MFMTSYLSKAKLCSHALVGRFTGGEPAGGSAAGAGGVGAATIYFLVHHIVYKCSDRRLTFAVQEENLRATVLLEQAVSFFLMVVSSMMRLCACVHYDTGGEPAGGPAAGAGGVGTTTIDFLVHHFVYNAVTNA